MIIAVEGMDGAGKTTISRHIERKYKFINIEKPCKYLYEDEHGKIDYMRFKKDLDRIYKKGCRERSEYFGEGNRIAVTRYPGENIVLDRHLASNYYWNGNKKLYRFYDNLVEECGTPDLTIFLYATPKERLKRLRRRNPMDIDIFDKSIFDDGTYKHIEFLNRYNFNYVMIDTNDKSIIEVCREVDCKINEMMYKQDGENYAYRLRRGNRKSD